MPSPIDQARCYLDKIPGAESGNNGHGQTFHVACLLVHSFALSSHDAYVLMCEYSAKCNPPWSQREIEHKLADALVASHDKPRGHLLRSGYDKPAIKRHVKNGSTTGPDIANLPDPIEDGARLLIRSAFAEGEGIRIVNAKLDEDHGGEIPDGAGPCLSREEWLRKLDKVKGNPNGLFSSARKTGIYIAINPLKIGGSKDSDVTAYRHALVEFDEGLSPIEQWNLYEKSRLPCAAIIYSGGKSVHAWVKIEAKTRAEYDERVKALYAHFEGAGHHLDTKNKNPGRLSRLPFCVRFERRQELLALNTGCESFSEWLAEVQADGIGTVTTVQELLDYDTSADPNSVLGNRWLCRGGSCLIIGPSGVGKSSLAAQMLACWAVGRPAFGITTVRPLKILVVQAENDTGDLAEMVQGVASGAGLSDLEDFKQNIVFVRDTTHTGNDFTVGLRRLIDRHKPDLVFLDPLLSFIGADISKQEVCSQFLRTWLNPIAEATGVIWFCIHHTGKPSNDPKARKHWKTSDYSYSGIGSSELTNWTRATAILDQVDTVTFRLMFTKRGKRAKARHPSGEPTEVVWLKHVQTSIFWEQIEPPEEPEQKQRSSTKGNAGRPDLVGTLSKFDFSDLTIDVPIPSQTKMAGALIPFIEKKWGKEYKIEFKSATKLVKLLMDEGWLAYDESSLKNGKPMYVRATPNSPGNNQATIGQQSIL